MNLPTDTLTLIDWLVVFAVPIVAGFVVSSLLERAGWFQSIEAKNAVVLAVSTLGGFALTLLRQWLIANPDALNAIDPYIKTLLSTLALYLTTQIAHGKAKAKGLR